MRELRDFEILFKSIRNRGFIKSHRAGTTGIGKTFEDLIGVEENPIIGPDFGEYEVKTQRENSNSMLTIITKSPLPDGVNKQILLKYGYDNTRDGVTKKILHITLSSLTKNRIKNSTNYLYIQVNDQHRCGESAIVLYSNNGVEEGYWPISQLSGNVKAKYGEFFINVVAKTKKIGQDEYFHYTQAFLIGGVTPESIIALVRSGKIKVDIRMGQNPDGSFHDHGTGFRIKPSDRNILFTSIEEIAK